MNVAPHLLDDLARAFERALRDTRPELSRSETARLALVARKAIDDQKRYDDAMGQWRQAMAADQSAQA